MAKSKSSSSSDKNTRNLIIVAAVVILVGAVAFFAEKQKVKEVAVVPPGSSTGVQVLHLKPDQGCKVDASGSNYECNMLVRNDSETPLDWFGQIEGIEGATLSNNGEGTVEPNNNAIVTLTVPVSYCESNPEGMGTVSIKDTQKSTNESLASFYCSEVEGKGDAAAE